MINNDFLAHTFGIMALGFCLTAFAPTFLKFNKQYLINKTLIIQIANIGILLSIFCGLIHGLIMTQKAEIDFYNIQTYWVYGAGLFTLNLLIFLALGFKELTRDLKKLNYFTYAGLFLLICHLGKYLSF